MKNILTIKEFLKFVENGKIGVDVKLLKPNHLDLGRASDHLRNGLPTVWITKKKPLNYKPAKIIYGFTNITSGKEIYYLTVEGINSFGDIIKLLGPGNDHLWVDLQDTSIIPVEKAVKLPIGRAVSLKTVISPAESKEWIALHRSLPWTQNYTQNLENLNTRLLGWERIKIKFI